MKIAEKNGTKWIDIFNGDDLESVMEAAKNNDSTVIDNDRVYFRVKPHFGIMDDNPILVDEEKLRQLLDFSEGFQQ